MSITASNDCDVTFARELASAEETSARPARRILIVLHDFSGGGTERVAIKLANQWALAGRSVAIFCGNEAGPLRELVHHEVVVEIADPPLKRATFSRIRLGFALTGASRRFRPDVIFAPGNFHMLVLASFAYWGRPKALTVCKISNPLVRGDRHGTAGWFRHFILKVLTRRLDILVTMSPALRPEAAGLAGEERVKTRWDPILPDMGIPPVGIARQPGLVVTIARLEPQKNLGLAVEAMAYLSRWTDARLVILGEGSQRKRLQRLIDRLGLHGRVLLEGEVRDPKLWLQRASCFLMTSHYEGYPASLIEALACGTPVLVTPCSPALADIMPLAPMARVVSPDPGAIAFALQTMLRHPRPPSAEPLLVARHHERCAAASYLTLMDDIMVRRTRTAR